MSLEQMLERIAVALETIAANKLDLPVAPAPATEPKVRTKKAEKSTLGPIAAPSNPGDVDPTPETPQVVATAPAVVTEEILRDALKRHVIKFGKDATGRVISKFGAKANAPLIADIDKTKYNQCVAALELDLKNGKTGA